MKIKILTILSVITQLLYPQQELKIQLDSLLADKFFNSTICAIDAYDLTAGKPLYQLNNKMLLHPASNMKVITSAAALNFLGDNYQFVTTFCHTGEIKDDILEGDLYVVGGLDPAFTYGELDSVLAVLKSKGIKSITGNIYCDLSMCDSLYWGNGWMWDDEPFSDMPYLSALNINENSVVVKAKGVKKGKAAGIELIPETDYFSIINNAGSSDLNSDNDLQLSRDWLNKTNVILASGNIKEGDEKVVKLSVIKPYFYFLTLLKEKINGIGIKFSPSVNTGNLPAGSDTLYTFRRNIDTVITRLNKVSDNLSGEMLLRAMAEKYYGKPASAKKGIQVIDSLITLAGLNPDNYRIVDGSGLSHYNLVSSELLLGILKYMYYTQPVLHQKLYNSFPVAGVDGTLKTRMSGTAAFKNVHAKTGTLSGVSCLSGYVTAANGNLVAFSIMIQNHVNNYSKAIYFQNQVCNILANYR